MANLYKRYLRLLDKWPVDPLRDPKTEFGAYLREQVKIAFAKGDNSKIENKEECLKNLEALERLANNHYQKKYPITPTDKTASGLTLEQCQFVLSKEYLDYAAKRKLGFFQRLGESVKNIYFQYQTPSQTEKK
ncbi:hypothetical protein TKK_0009592 [Trichogramma kaykai]|uniref:Mitochondrial nucleoid factor 1 n=1 Tax=Trichogramma kaykai TaxID=54128 RepID=A0ABD2X0D9_9HYME